MTTLLEATGVALAAVPRMYVAGSVPASPTYPYGVYSASFGRGDAYSLDVAHGLRWVRVVVQTFGRTSAAALDQMEKARTALEDKRLTVTDWAVNPLVMELDPTPPTRDPDDAGVMGTTATYTTTATKE